MYSELQVTGGVSFEDDQGQGVARSRFLRGYGFQKGHGTVAEAAEGAEHLDHISWGYPFIYPDDGNGLSG